MATDNGNRNEPGSEEWMRQLGFAPAYPSLGRMLPEVSEETQAFIDAEKKRLGVSTNLELLKAKLDECRSPNPDQPPTTTVAVRTENLAAELAYAMEVATGKGWDAAAASFIARPALKD